MTTEFDIIIAGGGHNGLACGAVLTKEGLSVLVVERNPWLGGCVATREVTLPGFRHDMYGSSHVWIHLNEEFKKLKPELEKFGLEYIWADDHITGHPYEEGPGIVVYKDVNKTVESIAKYSEEDAKRYKEIYDGFMEIKDGVVANMFTTPAKPSLMTSVMEDSEEGLEMLRNYSLSPTAWVKENFKHPIVQSFILGWAMAPQIWPYAEGGGQSFYVMIPAIHYFGESIPKGGTDKLPRALAGYIESKGGKVLTGATVTKFNIEEGECKGLTLENGQKFTANKAVVSSLDVKQTFLKLVDKEHLPEKFIRMAESFSFGKVSIVRAHYALKEAPIFKNGADMSKTSFQRIFGTLEDIEVQYSEIGLNTPPSNPFLWTACWTLKDPSRAPDGNHTLIMDTFVSYKMQDGNPWTDEQAKKYVDDVMLPILQKHTTNMGRENILGEYIDHAARIAQDNWSLVDGTTSGGERTMAQMGYFRPVPGYSDYRSPVKKLWMTGPSTHPGNGITAMGTVTAVEMLEEFGMREKVDEFDF